MFYECTVQHDVFLVVYQDICVKAVSATWSDVSVVLEEICYYVHAVGAFEDTAVVRQL